MAKFEGCKLCILRRQNLLPIQVLLKSCQTSELVPPSGDAEGSMAAMEWNQNVALMPSHELGGGLFIAEKLSIQYNLRSDLFNCLVHFFKLWLVSRHLELVQLAPVTGGTFFECQLFF